MIGKFIDAFAGSAIISMNVIAKEYVVNDINPYLYDLYNMFRFFSSNVIIDHINERIENGEITGYFGEDSNVIIPSSYSLDNRGNIIEGNDFQIVKTFIVSLKTNSTL